MSFVVSWVSPVEMQIDISVGHVASMPLEHRGWVLVTGASGGIGRAAVCELGARGYNVLAAVRRTAQWQPPPVGRAEALELNLQSAPSIDAAVAAVEALSERSPLVGIVSNAGIALPGPFEAQPFDDILSQIHTNILGPLRLIQPLIARLRASRGCLIVVSSLAGRLPMPFNATHCGTKHFLEGAFESLKMELGTAGVRVAIVEPGPVRTPMAGKFSASAHAVSLRLDPQMEVIYGRRFTTLVRSLEGHVDFGAPPEDVAQLIVDILENPRPRTRYAAGRRASLLLLLARILPDALRHRLVARFFGLHERPSLNA